MIIYFVLHKLAFNQELQPRVGRRIKNLKTTLYYQSYYNIYIKEVETYGNAGRPERERKRRSDHDRCIKNKILQHLQIPWSTFRTKSELSHKSWEYSNLKSHYITHWSIITPNNLFICNTKLKAIQTNNLDNIR